MQGYVGMTERVRDERSFPEAAPSSENNMKLTAASGMKVSVCHQTRNFQAPGCAAGTSCKSFIRSKIRGHLGNCCLARCHLPTRDILDNMFKSVGRVSAVHPFVFAIGRGAPAQKRISEGRSISAAKPGLRKISIKAPVEMENQLPEVESWLRPPSNERNGKDDTRL